MHILPQQSSKNWDIDGKDDKTNEKSRLREQNRKKEGKRAQERSMKKKNEKGRIE